MTKRLFKLLSINLIATLIVSALLTFVTYRLLSTRDTSSIEGKQADIIMAEAGVSWVLILSLSSLTIYLNLRRDVRQKAFISVLSFFLIPMVLTILFFLTRDDDTEWRSFNIGTFYFFAVQIGSYLTFRKLTKIKNGVDV